MAGQPWDSRELEAKLIVRAWKDPRFFDELRRNPKAVVERELAAVRPGVKLAPSLAVTVVEETPSTMYLVVPPRPQPSAELSAVELSQVSAGYSQQYPAGHDPWTDCTVTDGHIHRPTLCW